MLLMCVYCVCSYFVVGGGGGSCVVVCCRFIYFHVAICVCSCPVLHLSYNR